MLVSGVFYYRKVKSHFLFFFKTHCLCGDVLKLYFLIKMIEKVVVLYIVYLEDKNTIVSMNR